MQTYREIIGTKQQAEANNRFVVDNKFIEVKADKTLVIALLVHVNKGSSDTFIEVMVREQSIRAMEVYILRVDKLKGVYSWLEVMGLSLEM